MNTKQKKLLIRLIISTVMTIALNILKFDFAVELTLYITAYLIVGYDVLKKAVTGIKKHRLFNEKFLMSIATIGAFCLALYTNSGDYNEAVAVMLFYQLGEFFESYAVGQSKKSISKLMDIRPDYANIEKEGKLTQISPDQISIGTVIIVRPGEKVPLDGIILNGASTLNTTALTGESAPVSVKAGDEILSGCINLSGLLKIKTTKEYGDSTVSKILELVENSSKHKAHSENFITKFAAVYTPVICYSAMALAIMPPLITLLFTDNPAQWSIWIYRALTFLVISCPCALVISIPLTFFAGIGGASRDGILIKGSNYMEALSKAKYVVFDKTGTLTHGNFEVNEIHHNAIDEKVLLEYVALAEYASSHPISISLKNACKNITDPQRVSDIKEISGEGVIATVDGKTIAAGNEKLMKRLNIQCKPCHHPGTIIHVSINQEYCGHIVISDKVKNNTKESILELKKNGIKNAIMLTGDSKKAADYVAKSVGIDTYAAELLPEDKVKKVEELLSQKRTDETLVFVGDGINDAPVLMRADIGISMGAMGSDAAIEASDIVLMDDNPMKLVKAIKISKKCLRIVYQNIFFALAVKFTCLGLGALGITNMWFAIFADVGVMVLAVLNAMRALRVHQL